MRITAKSTAGKRKFLSEKRLAYVLITPAVLVILSIAFYPVLQTFYLSLFDMRLNHPTRNTTHLVHKIDLEKYADFDIRVRSALNRLKSDAHVQQFQDEIHRLDALVKEYNEVLTANQRKKEQYLEVYEKVSRFETIHEDSLRYVRLSSNDVEHLMQIIHEMEMVFGLISSEQIISSHRDASTVSAFIVELPRTIVFPNFVGFDNYRLLFSDSRLWHSLRNTFTFVFFAVAFELVFGIMIALLINMSFKGRGVLRAVVLIPWSIPAAVNGLIWRSMYDGQFGVVSNMLARIGFISSPAAILTSTSGAMIGLIAADIWKTTPFMALLILGGLQTIDRDLFEAAIVDGAGRIQTFFRIILPLLKNTIIIAVIFRSLDTFRVFDLVYVLTGGGPANTTETITVFAYKTMFAQMNFGRGSTLSVIVFICVSFLSIMYIKFLDSDLFKHEVN